MQKLLFTFFEPNRLYILSSHVECSFTLCSKQLFISYPQFTEHQQPNVSSTPLKILAKRLNLLIFEQKVWRTWAYFREKCCINAKMVVFLLNPIALQPLLCGVLTTFCQQLDRMGQKGWYCGCKNPPLLLPCTGKKCFRKNHEMLLVQSVYSVCTTVYTQF